MGEMNTKRLNSLLKREFERGLSEGYKVGYQAGIIEGIHRQTLVNAQINQILGDK